MPLKHCARKSHLSPRRLLCLSQPRLSGDVLCHALRSLWQLLSLPRFEDYTVQISYFCTHRHYLRSCGLTATPVTCPAGTEMVLAVCNSPSQRLLITISPLLENTGRADHYASGQGTQRDALSIRENGAIRYTSVKCEHDQLGTCKPSMHVLTHGHTYLTHHGFPVALELQIHRHRPHFLSRYICGQPAVT